MAQQPIPDTELSQAKELIVRSLPTRFETSSDAAASYAVPFIYDLGLSYWSNYPKEIATVDAAAAQAAANKYIQPGRMIAVAVGDRAKIQPELEKLSLGAIEIRNADANVVPRATGGAGREK